MIGVLDASLAVPLILPIAGIVAPDQAMAEYELHAPDLLALETANVVWNYVRLGRLAVADGRRALAIFAGLPVAYRPDRPLADAAFDLALELDHPVDDCTYLALALASGGTVLTRDKRFAAAASRYGGRVRVLE